MTNCNVYIVTASFSSCRVWERDSVWFIWKRCARAKLVLAAPGAASAVIEDGRTGIIAEIKCKDELLGALLALIGQPQRTVQMGNAGYERFLNNFTADRFGNSLLAALQWEHRGAAKCAE